MILTFSIQSITVKKAKTYTPAEMYYFQSFYGKNFILCAHKKSKSNERKKITSSLDDRWIHYAWSRWNKVILYGSLRETNTENNKQLLKIDILFAFAKENTEIVISSSCCPVRMQKRFQLIYYVSFVIRIKSFFLLFWTPYQFPFIISFIW